MKLQELSICTKMCNASYENRFREVTTSYLSVTRQQALDYLLASEGGVCGKFNSEQLLLTD
jgi:hypothetical protein